MFEEQTAPYDRITQILQSRTQPTPMQISMQDLSNIASGGDTNYFGLQREAEQDATNNALNILKIFEAKKASGDRQAQALDSRIKMFTGDDPQGMALMLQNLHEDPDQIDPSNSYQVMSKLAAIVKRTGYISPALSMEKEKKQLELQRMKAEINRANRPDVAGDLPATIQIANELQKARSAGDQQRVNDLLSVQKVLKFDPGLQIDETGTVVPLPGYAAAETGIKTSVKLGENIAEGTGKNLTEKRIKAEEAVLTLSSNRQAVQLLDSGMITGFGADYITGFGRMLNQIGFSAAKDPVANTQAYTALRAKEVGRIIKLFGAGTGLSDADREYAEKAAAGQVTLDEAGLRRIIKISDEVAQEAISIYNTELSRVPKEAIPYDISIEPPAQETKIKFLGFEK